MSFTTRQQMQIQYEINENIKPELFRQLLIDSGLGDRRLIDDLHCIKGMIENSNLIISAWLEDELIGIARSVTDFHYCCFLSDLAVHKDYQKQGIGKQLQVLTQERLGEHCKLTLRATPSAADYFQQIGYELHDRCWVLGRNTLIR